MTGRPANTISCLKARSVFLSPVTKKAPALLPIIVLSLPVVNCLPVALFESPPPTIKFLAPPVKLKPLYGPIT